ncbi:MAG: hypothetical protein EAX95_06250 [Candidatus Thorarchaeota archaeon]|nr:hypothetical protein [Candidatus Thorarchaeota archaeon]
MARIENPLLVSLYSQWVDRVLAETSNIEEANERLRELGREMGSHIYLSTEIAEKTKDSVMTREDVSKLVEIIYKVLFNKKPTDVDMKTARGSVRVTDEECIWCQDITLEGMRGFGYCEGFSGIMESILQFKGVEAKVFQELCRATGADNCTWNIRL